MCDIGILFLKTYNVLQQRIFMQMYCDKTLI